MFANVVDVPASYEERVRLSQELRHMFWKRYIGTYDFDGIREAMEKDKGYGNIVGTGFGIKTSSSASDGKEGAAEFAFLVYVRKKIPTGVPHVLLSEQYMIPPTLEGFSTDVVEIGDVEFSARNYDVLCGASIGHKSVSFGTLGCLVKEVGSSSETRYILSASHVMGALTGLPVDDVIYEPGFNDKKTTNPTQRIGQVVNTYNINTGGYNDMDAAIARVDSGEPVKPTFHSLTKISSGLMEPDTYVSVRKHGRGTGPTVGVIMGVGVTIDVTIPGTRQKVSFQRQIEVAGIQGQTFAKPGDSGSLLVDGATKSAVALLIATGTSGRAFATPIDTVLKQSGVEIVDN